MIKWTNTPLDDVIKCAEKVYGQISCTIEIVPIEEEKTYGCTTFCDDGEIVVTLNAAIPYMYLLEILAHELAHVIAGKGHDHDETWEKIFDNIHKEYDRYAREKYWTK